MNRCYGLTTPRARGVFRPLVDAFEHWRPPYTGRMLFTPLHRYLGESPGPLTEEMVDEAIQRGVSETDDLDWKAKLPQQKDLMRSDLPKDIAAMANSGGGMLVFGVEESQRAATGRVDAGEMNEAFERSLRKMAYSAISPPVTGFAIYPLGEPGARIVALVIPDSANAPHLVFRDQAFSAPIRNDSDTEWMREREIEAAYRSRFSALADSTALSNELYEESQRAYAPQGAAVIIAVAVPRHVQRPVERERGTLAGYVHDAWNMTEHWTAGESYQILSNVNGYDPRVGFRRWILPWNGKDDTKYCHAAVHHDGAVSMAWRIGAQRSGPETFDPSNDVTSQGIEVFAASFLALVRAVAESGPSGDMVVQLGIEWSGKAPLFCNEVDARGDRMSRRGVFGSRFARVRDVIDVRAAEDDFYARVRSFAGDCVSQFGISGLSHLMRPPLPPRRA